MTRFVPLFLSIILLQLIVQIKAIGGIPPDINRIEFFEKKQKVFYQIDIHQNLVKLIRLNQKDTLIKPLKSQGIDLKEIPPSFFSNAFEKRPNIYWLTILGTGQVYEFSILDFTIKRIDRTYFRGHNFLSIQLMRNDTLFSFGGMGFWHSHNINIYFNEQHKEWELYQTKGNLPARFSSRIGGYQKQKNNIYVAELPDIYEDQGKTSYLFVYNFEKNEWTKLGKINQMPKGFWDHNRLEGKWIDPFLFSEELENFFIDPANNKTYELTDDLNLFFHSASEIVSSNNYLYVFKKNNTPNQSIEMDSISVDELRKKSKVIGQFYTPISLFEQINLPYFIMGLAILLALFFYFFFNKYRNKVQKLELLNNNTPPEYYYEFLEFILNKPDLSCSTNELNDLIFVSDKPLDTQRQYRSKFISQVNKYISTNFDVSEGIERGTSKNDKRFVYYKVSQELLKKLKGN